MLTETEIPEQVHIEPIYELVQASAGKRFANYLIDLLFFYLIAVLWMVVAAIIFPSFADAVGGDDSMGGLGDRIVSLLLYGLTMSLIEGMCRGKSIGKFVTGTKAVNEDGSDISFSTAFGRGFSRAIPFNAFSALGNPSYPWHDKWTNTYVIDVKATRRQNEQSMFQ